MTYEDEKKDLSPPIESVDSGVVVGENEELVNTSGHVQELDRNLGVISICSLGILSDNAWGAGGGALVVALYNGGGPGVVYGLIAAVVFYSFIAAALAELASAIPSSASVYHWASVAGGPKYGKMCSFFAGWWNCLAWIFGAASISLVAGETVMAMYTVTHPDYVLQRGHVFIVYLIITWLDLAMVLFGQRFLAKAGTVLGLLLMLLFVISTLIVAIMPSQTGAGYASNTFVWGEWQNLTGWSSNGLVFAMGVLNGAYAIGTPDGVSHLSEEVPNPKRNVPWGMLAQMSTGAISSFCFYVAVLYGVTDLNAVFNSSVTALPLAAMYQQAVGGSNAGTLGLLFLFLLAQVINIPAGYLTCSRMLWTLARDDATPFSAWVRHIDPRWRNPFNAGLCCGVAVTILGLIYVGNGTAFTAIVGSFTILTTWSYCAAILPHMLSRRQYIAPFRGPFWMSPAVFYPVAAIACAYILVFNVLYMFPYVYPTTVATMNYACVMTAGLTVLLAVLYFVKGSTYVGPQVTLHGRDDIITGLVGLSKEEEERMRRASVH